MLDCLGLCTYISDRFPRLLESPGFFPKIFRTWKVLEIKFKVLESPGIYLWFNLTNMPFMSSAAYVNKCMKYSCNVLTEQFLCNL